MLKIRNGMLPSILSILIVVLGMGCSKPTPTPLPIAEDTMIKILADVHIAEAALATFKKQKRDSLAPVYYNQIYAIHNTDSSTYNTTFEILQNEPTRFNKLYEAVFERLAILKESNKANPPKTKKRTKK